MRDEFSTLDIVKALEIQRERLREWMVQEFIKPTVSASGKGTRALFTRKDVYCVELFRQLVDIGINRDTAHHFSNFYRNRSMSDNEDLYYMLIRYGVQIGRDNHEYGPEYSALFLAKDMTINLERGCAGDKSEMSHFFTDDWRILHLINLHVLKQNTDTMLNKL